jgi:mannose-1-phosphate guanylyltransferase
MLLGMTPDKAEVGYGWIEPKGTEVGWESRRVKGFWEKPSNMRAQVLLKRAALWNTFVFVTQANTLWQIVRQAAPDLYDAFLEIRRTIGSPQAEYVTQRVYSTLRPVNFSSGICEPLSARLRVFPVPEIGWSDWGSVERILTSLDEMGKLEQGVTLRSAIIAEETGAIPTWRGLPGRSGIQSLNRRPRRSAESR